MIEENVLSHEHDKCNAVGKKRRYGNRKQKRERGLAIYFRSRAASRKRQRILYKLILTDLLSVQ